MNVVLHGILPLLLLTALLLAAVLPSVVASWTRRAVAVAVAAGGRQVRLCPTGSAVIEQANRWILMDVAAAHQSWRAPPTVRPQIASPTSAEVLGRRRA